jgi:hypothetical protein
VNRFSEEIMLKQKDRAGQPQRIFSHVEGAVLSDGKNTLTSTRY